MLVQRRYARIRREGITRRRVSGLRMSWIVPDQPVLLTALVTKLPAEIKDILAGTKDPVVLQYFTERRLRPLTIMPIDERQD